MKVLSVGILCLFAATSFAQSEERKTVNDFLEAAENSEMLQQWVGQFGQGVFLSNRWLQNEGKEALFCAPEKLNMTPEQYFSILKDRMKRVDPDRLRDDFTWWQGHMISALIETFPCE